MSREHDDALLSVAQAATLLGVHPNTIRTWTDAGRLNAYRINARGDRRLRRVDVVRLLVEDRMAPGELDDAGYRVFARLAEGLATAPTIGSVGRALTTGLREEIGLSRVAVYVLRDGELVLVAHAGQPVPPARRGDARIGPLRENGDLALPLATLRTPIGSVIIDAGEEHLLPKGLAHALGVTAATVMAAAERLTRSRRELQRVRALRSVTKELIGTLDLTQVLDDIIERTRTLFAADRAGIWLFHDTPHPIALVTRGLSDAFLARSAELTRETDTIAIRALREGRPLWTRDAGHSTEVGEMRPAYEAEGITTACIVPLVSRGAPLGVIGLYHDIGRNWPDEEVDLVQAFADQAAVAIQNARLYRSVADQAARIRSIQDLSARLNRLTDVRAIAEAIVAEARTLAEYHDIRIYRVDRELGICEPIAFTRKMLLDARERPEDLLRVGIGEGFTGWVAEHGEPLLINNVLDDERGKTIDGTDDVPESMLVVPMLYEGLALGVIVLSQLGYDRFTADDLQTMTIFAGYAAQAMANATTYETLAASSAELARRAELQRRLLDINERLLTTLDPASVLETIADGLRGVVAYDNLSIYRVDDIRQAMLPVLVREHHAEEVSRYIIPFGRGLMGWAVGHGQPILANDALNDPRALQIPGTPPDPEAVIVVPLIAEGSAIGALNVSRIGGPEIHFSASDFEFVQLFAAQASIALRNADAHHATQQLADTDALTGLGNHGAFQRDLRQAIDAAGGGDGRASRLTLLMMDLDHFKTYNDRYGHPAGDELLHRVATAIYGAVRSDDRVYRYGGDEFALPLPGVTRAEAARLASRIRAAVARLTAEDPSPVTITIGVAGLGADAPDRPALIAAADAALYDGKREGGDRVVRADALPASRAARTSFAEVPSRRRAAALGDRDRVARLAARMAGELALSDAERRDVELAARLEALNDAAIAELGDVASMRGAAAIVAGARQLVAAAARRERRAARPRGSIGGHIVTAAAAYDRLVSAGGETRLGRHDAIEALRRDPATYRSDVLAALARAVGQREDRGRRRRQADARGKEAAGVA
jgi:diguanylate cyclase (GGDEF)-like protein/excisionase family DNA binding protein